MVKRISDPVPGFFKIKLVRGGPYVAARLEFGPGVDPETGEELDRSYMWTATVAGKVPRLPSPDPVKAGAMNVWLHGIEITEADYRYLIDSQAWELAHGTVEPRKATDLSKMKPITP
jgi:hypothetical protein